MASTDRVLMMLVMMLTIMLVVNCRGLAIGTPTSSPMVVKMEEITRHLQELTKSMADLDRELQEAVIMSGVKDGVSKRASTEDEDDFDCRLHLHEAHCQARELLQEQMGFLHTPLSPGKRSGDVPAINYRKLAADLRKKREILHNLSDVFNNAAHIMEREKKWMTCNLNLGFTCQTQEYSNIADYYDFLNSADSPGKKRSVRDSPNPQA